MLEKKELEEIKEHLEKAQNPIFYYDNDADGLCAFLLLRRFLGRGYGVAVKSYPYLDERYAQKAEQLKADYIFVLDKPLISKEFLEAIDRMQLPLIWIDHHDVMNAEFWKEFEKFNNFEIFNPMLSRKKSSEPVSYLAYKITGRKDDLWIALMGCIADHYMPDFAKEFAEKYPEFWNKSVKEPFDVYYKSEIGKIAVALNFGLKDSVTNVVAMQNFFISCKTPADVFLEGEKNKAFRQKYAEIKKKYGVLLEEAKENVKEKIIFFSYSGDLSISSDLANELSYLYPGKYVAVGYKKGPIVNISMRGKNVRMILDKILKDFGNATGGGHMDAVGAKIRTEDFERFKERFENEAGK
jgi:single-stranded DNA-specific DHH superfamily exonuclease